MVTMIGAPIVAGIDGPEDRQAVLDLAIGEARLRSRRLVLLHAYDWALLSRSFVEPPYGAVQQLFHDSAAQVRDEALAVARATAPDLDIEAQVRDGGAARVLIEASRQAGVLVVGHRGSGGFPGLRIGSVASQVAAHAACPVIVVRPSAGTGPNAGRVVVGVDGSPGSAPALRFAFEEAVLRHTGLTAVHAWRLRSAADVDDVLPLVYDADDVHDVECRVLAEAVAGCATDFPDVDVRRVVVRARPARAVVEAASGCALAVVGTRGRGGFAGLLLGSVSQAALHHVACPLAVVPAQPG